MTRRASTNPAPKPIMNSQMPAIQLRFMTGLQRKKGRPRLTVKRHREEPTVDKLIEAHPISWT